MKKQATHWGKHVQNTNLIKNWYPKYKKNSHISIIRKLTTQFKNWRKDLETFYKKKDIQKIAHHH